MADTFVPSSGPISFSNLMAAFPIATRPFNFSLLYGANANVPTQGQPLSMSAFRNQTAPRPQFSLTNITGSNMSMNNTGAISGTAGGTLTVNYVTYLIGQAAQYHKGLTFALTAGSLPTGASLNNSGVLTVGTSVAAGNTNGLQVTVTNGWGKSVSIPLSLAIVAASLYTFTSFTFSPCGATGAYGPTIQQCRSFYATNFPLETWTQNNSFLGMDTSGIQIWTVPRTGSYRFTVAGAAGGFLSTGNTRGGRGAILTSSNITLNQSAILYIVVGQMGGNGNTGASLITNTGGGGGGTYVFLGSTLLFVAGGGAGATGYNTVTGASMNEGVDAPNQLSTTASGGTGGEPLPGNAGDPGSSGGLGIGGNAGTVFPYTSDKASGAGGGGGAGSPSSTYRGGIYLPPFDTYNSEFDVTLRTGGFGGGGAASAARQRSYSGGGGGGHVGGAAGSWVSVPQGGTSFGTNVTLGVGNSGNTGHGYVTVQYIG